jgi:hypothetical protein
VLCLALEIRIALRRATVMTNQTLSRFHSWKPHANKVRSLFSRGLTGFVSFFTSTIDWSRMKGMEVSNLAASQRA